ncbi:MAG: ComEC family competence protein [Oscillospiraceae bacterium]|jgi:competence protein ComEC|nr:ComEC family competence protein [Oscillospiraceae bacterium]
MKRPFAVIGITYLLSQTVALLFGFAAALATAVFLIMALAVYLVTARRRKAIAVAMLLTSGAAMLVSALYSNYTVKPADLLSGQTAYIKGRVDEQPEEKSGRYYYIVETEFIGLSDVKQNVKLRLSSKEKLRADYSDIIECTVQFNQIKEEYNSPSRISLLADKIVLTAFLPKGSAVRVSEGEDDLYSYALRLREKIIEKTKRLWSKDTAGFAAAIIIGDKSGVSRSDISDFRGAGLSHVLCISGLHMSIVADALSKLLRRLKFSRKQISIIVIPVVVIFIMTTGMSPSAVRSGIMLIILYFGKFIGRTADSINSLGVAVFLICLFNPYAAADAGLLLSFSATFGLLSMSERCYKLVNKKIMPQNQSFFADKLRDICKLFLSSLVCSVFTMPAAVMFFGELSVISPISNVLLLYPASLFMLLCMAAVALTFLGAVGSVIAYPIFVCAWMIGEAVLFCVRLFSSMPGAVMSTHTAYAAIAFIGALIIFLYWYFLFSKTNRTYRRLSAYIAVCFSLLVWFAGSFSYGIVSYSREQITVFSVENGVLVLLSDRGSDVLIGVSGDAYDIEQAYYAMRDRGIREPDALILPDGFEQNAQATRTLLTDFPPRLMLFEAEETKELAAGVYSGEIVHRYDSEAKIGRIEVNTMRDRTGQTWTLAQAGEMSILLCPAKGDCADNPFKDAAIDAVLISSNDVANLSTLNTSAVIVSMDMTDGAITSGYMKARGFENVFCTGTDGNLGITKDGIFLKIGMDRK